jgi:2-polyprenyl-6-methoxyphenol hydroxylase-like FAD-dependent oxidoreductase
LDGSQRLVGNRHGTWCVSSHVRFRGPAAHVAERMNIASQLRDARIRLDGMTLLDSTGRRVARVDIGTPRSLLAPYDIEIARGDLALILHTASADHAEYVFGDSIMALIKDDNGVDVTFERSRARRFDLVGFSIFVTALVGCCLFSHNARERKCPAVLLKIEYRYSNNL